MMKKISIAILLLYGLSVYAETCGIVKTQRTPLNIRQYASTTSRIIDQASKGSALGILGRYGSWYKVKLNNGVIGYGSADYIKKVSTQSDETCGIVQTQQTPVNIRQYASTTSRIIDQASKDSALRILGRDGSWYKVKLNNGTIGYGCYYYIENGGVNFRILDKNESCNPSSYSNQPSNYLPKVFITYLGFMDPSAGMTIESGISTLINRAVRAGVQLAQQDMPHLKLNDSGHRIENYDENVNQFINIFFDFNLTKGEKIEAIIQKMMTPNGVDVIFTGQYLEKTGGVILVRPLMLSKSHRRTVTRSLIFQKNEFMCSYNALCQGAHEQIRDAVKELLGNL